MYIRGHNGIPTLNSHDPNVLGDPHHVPCFKMIRRELPHGLRLSHTVQSTSHHTSILLIPQTVVLMWSKYSVYYTIISVMLSLQLLLSDILLDGHPHPACELV